MGKECTMPEVLKVTDEREDDEFELNLELSIGGSYGKKSGYLNKMEGKTRDPFEEKEKVLMANDVGLLKTDFSSCGKRGDVGGGENGCEFMDLPRKRESQVIKRQEARKKREEKINKSLGSKGMSSGGFAVDKLFLESQQLKARVQDREMKESDGMLNRKRGKNGTDEVDKDLNLSLFKEDKISGTANISSQQMQMQMQMQMQCLLPQVQYVPLRNGIAYRVVPSMGPNVGKVEKNEGNLFGSLACKNAGACWNGNGNVNSSIECYLEQSNVESAWGNRQTVSNGSLEQSSSAVSDYHSTTQKGESGSDTGSHSSPLCSNLRSTVPRMSNVSEHLESNNTSSRAQLKHQHVISIPQSSTSKSSEKSKPDNQSNQTTNTCSTPDNQTSPTLKETRAGLIEKPPKPPNNHHSIASVSHMPCVSTTGNGPNAKTIRGILYKYTKMEVSIMCTCHGNYFTPAGFVEHAGGVDISHPMRHITIVPSAIV